MRLVKLEKFILIVALSFFVLAVFARTYPYFPFDLIITRTIQNIDYPWFSSLMPWLTQIGDLWWASLSTIFIAGLFLLFNKRRESLMILISSFGLVILGFLIKAVVARPRPDASLIEQIERFVKADSFPSGHVLFFMGLYGFLILYFVRKKRSTANKTILTSLILVILMMGFTRIYLGAHWFSDVLGAYLLGLLWLYFIGQIYFKPRHY